MRFCCKSRIPNLLWCRCSQNIRDSYQHHHPAGILQPHYQKKRLCTFNSDLNRFSDWLLKNTVDTCVNEMLEKYEGNINLFCAIPSVDRNFAITIISKIGTDMNQFVSFKRLCCWAGLTPGNGESARKKKSMHIIP